MTTTHEVPGKMRFEGLSSEHQAAVLANRTIPYYEAAITAMATSADEEGLARLTEEYNEARGLPGPGDYDVPTRGTTGTPDDTPYTGRGWDRDDLKDTADSRGLEVDGTGKDGYITKADYRSALIADDEKGE